MTRIIKDISGVFMFNLEQKTAPRNICGTVEKKNELFSADKFPG